MPILFMAHSVLQILIILYGLLQKIAMPPPKSLYNQIYYLRKKLLIKKHPLPEDLFIQRIQFLIQIILQSIAMASLNSNGFMLGIFVLVENAYL